LRRNVDEDDGSFRAIDDASREPVSIASSGDIAPRSGNFHFQRERQVVDLFVHGPLQGDGERCGCAFSGLDGK